MMCVRRLWSLIFVFFELWDWTNSGFFLGFFVVFFFFFTGNLNKHTRTIRYWSWIHTVCAHYHPTCARYQTEGLVQEESGVGLKQPSLKGNPGVILSYSLNFVPSFEETWESEHSYEPPAEFLMWNTHLCCQTRVSNHLVMLAWTQNWNLSRPRQKKTDVLDDRFKFPHILTFIVRWRPLVAVGPITAVNGRKEK